MSRKERNFRRLIFFGALIVVVLLICGNCRKSTVVSEDTYFVESGDTLWGIAQMHKPKEMDPREYIHLMKKMNEGLENEIKAGQAIIVPIMEER